METFAVVFDIVTPNGCQRQTIQAPRMMIEAQVYALFEQAARITTPMRVRMTRPVDIYIPADKSWVTREYYVEFANNAYIDTYGEIT